ncbi:MAG: saccharopine dehydrogenase NADP-binding domain-containing protein [Pontimonas sp.]|nr:MAG: ATP-binding protein [actinobacterium acMicro-4]MCF8523149.1 saccharopine dehydrogenase NADP-binding domain-containing protein [Pontimonas sp.]MCF8547727.1 saccharopine dehydrogenase NADP-binding domain-containing protein [Pontimonas sp.]
MKILLVGAGGVGNALAKLLATRDFYEHVIVADYDTSRAEGVLEWIAGRFPEARARFSAEHIDASAPENVTALAKKHGATVVMNAVEPAFVQSIFQGALDADADYMDMAMSLSIPHPTDPYNTPGIKLGDWQFDRATEWEKAGRLALIGMGVEPGISDVFAKYASDHLFSDIDEIGVRDGANLVVRDDEGKEIFAPSFSIWTTIEECLNPPLIWEKDRGWFTTEAFSEPEVFMFPAGIGPVECVNVEHEEVSLVPRFLNAKRVTFKYGLGAEFIGVLKTLNLLGLDKVAPVSVRTAPGPDGKRGKAEVSPRDLVAAVLPDPATLGDRMTGTTCAGVWVTGTGKDGNPREVFLYHASDNEWTMKNYDSQCVVWQTALAPAIALELLAQGVWSGTGVLGPEAFDAKPFLELMAQPEAEGGYGQAWGFEER